MCFRIELTLWFSSSFSWECQTCLTRNSGFLLPLIAHFVVQNNKKCYQIQQFKHQRFILFIIIFCLGASKHFWVQICKFLENFAVCLLKGKQEWDMSGKCWLKWWCPVRGLLCFTALDDLSKDHQAEELELSASCFFRRGRKSFAQ